MTRRRKQRGAADAPGTANTFRRAEALLRQGELSRALEICKAIVADDPAHVSALNLLGRIMLANRQFDDAINVFEQALVLQPGFLAALENLGIALRKQGSLAGAEDCFWRCTVMEPKSATAHSNLGAVLNNRGRPREAIAAHENAVDLEPKNAAAHSNLLFSLQYDADSTPERRLEAATRFGRQFAGLDARRRARYRNLPDPDRRLRIGYVSPDLGQHPVGVFLEGALEAHDRGEFEIFCYSDRPNEDGLSLRLAACCQAWRKTCGVADKALAKQITADRIDILVDLTGHSGNNRLLTFVLKPAPIQASWLGYGDTTGLSSIDYVITDPVTAPAASERWFVEQLVRLPHGRFCYKPPAYAPPVAPLPAATRGYVTFGSFNNLSKLNEQVVRLWAEVLRGVPGAHLLLKEKALAGEQERARIAQLFEAAGIGGERLELRGPEPHAELLANYGDMDIALDPFPFCGGLTSCEALWQGVPIVTMVRERPIARQTLGFLTALELTDLAAADSQDYLRITKSLCADLPALAKLRSDLRGRMQASPLCDCAGFAHDLDAAYRSMWRGWCATRKPSA